MCGTGNLLQRQPQQQPHNRRHVRPRIWQSDLIQINVVNPANLTATPISNSQTDLAWALNASNNNVLIATSPTTTFGVPADGRA
ncbi:MAG: hypothetical protein IPM81_22875 [Saprospirales bacterium]|nr:hypothetical protein [Saprospirales bacterium]